jgi:hypothetical protein
VSKKPSLERPSLEKQTRKDVTASAVNEAIHIAFNQKGAPDAIDIIADQSGEELRSLGGSLRLQRGILAERRAQVQHVVNALDAQIEVLDRAVALIEAN